MSRAVAFVLLLCVGLGASGCASRVAPSGAYEFELEASRRRSGSWTETVFSQRAKLEPWEFEPSGSFRWGQGQLASGTWSVSGTRVRLTPDREFAGLDFQNTGRFGVGIAKPFEMECEDGGRTLVWKGFAVAGKGSLVTVWRRKP